MTRSSDKRRLMVVSIAVGLALVACSGGDDEAATTTVPATTQTAPPTAASTTASPSTTTPASTAPPSTVATTTTTTIPAGMAMMPDIEGDRLMPITTERLWALDERTAVTLLALGITVDGANRAYGDPIAEAVLAAAGVELFDDDDFGAVLEATPNLVVGDGHPLHSEARVALEEFTAVLVIDPAQSWGGRLTALSTLTDTSARRRALVDAIDDRIDGLVGAIDASGRGGSTVSIVAGLGDDGFGALEPDTTAGRMARRLGLERPPAERGQGSVYGLIDLTAEQVSGATVDAFISVAGEQPDLVAIVDDAPNAEVAGGVEGWAWLGSTPLSVWWILDDVESIVVDGDASHAVGDAPDVFDDLIAAADATIDAAPASDDGGSADDSDDSAAADDDAAAANASTTTRAPAATTAPDETTVLDAASRNGATLVPTYSAFANGFGEIVNGPGPMTALLPDDDAFIAFADASPEFSAQLSSDPALLDELLLYHTIDGSLAAAALAGRSSITTTQGEAITISVDGDQIVLNDGQATIEISDLDVRNGTLHIIDGVLIPPSLATAAER